MQSTGQADHSVHMQSSGQADSWRWVRALPKTYAVIGHQQTIMMMMMMMMKTWVGLFYFGTVCIRPLSLHTHCTWVIQTLDHIEFIQV